MITNEQKNKFAEQADKYSADKLTEHAIIFNLLDENHYVAVSDATMVIEYLIKRCAKLEAANNAYLVQYTAVQSELSEARKLAEKYADNYQDLKDYRRGMNVTSRKKLPWES